MAAPATFDSFAAELSRLVAKFEKEFHEVTAPNYTEARLREDYLNPLISALGWDRENHAGLVQAKREIEIESRTDILGRAKRADYLFRTDGNDRFICEAKKPREELGPRYAFQAKRYAWNKKLHLALLTDFEELKVYLVGGKPRMDEPQAGEWKSWHYKQYPLVAQELWDMLSRERVAAGSIEAAIEALPKKPAGKGKARQAWLIKPDRIRELDTDFLEFLDDARRDLASDILKHNERADVLEGTRLNDAVQCILDRLLFIRICEDRDIDTGGLLQSIVDGWRRKWDREDGKKHRQESLRLREDSSLDLDDGGGALRSKLPRESLWRAVVSHFRALDRRPPSHVPFFNGNLFKPHFSEDLLVGDEWLAGFISELSDDESPYLFNVIPVEILGSVYERFLGKVVRPHGRGVTIKEKPEVRKAGGVYYTPRYIVDYIVEQTVGRQLDAIAGVENETSQSESRASGSAGFQPAASDFQSDAGSGVPGKIRASSPGRTPTGLRQDAEASGLEARAPHSIAKPRAVRFAEFEKSTRALRILDPACGSGSFLIRAFERVCEHWQRRFILHPRDRRAELCWVDPATDDVHLTVELKRRILRDNIHGVDLDAQAVEVTQLSLYLKMLEGEDRTTLQRQRELFADDTALLPPLQDNIKCGNSLIASDFSMMPEDLVRVNAFDWEVGFREIMKAGGFDAVIGNPPYIRIQGFPEDQISYLCSTYKAATGNHDIYVNFAERGYRLLKESGRFGMILPNKFFRTDYGVGLRRLLAAEKAVEGVVDFGSEQVFEATTYTCLLFLRRGKNDAFTYASSRANPTALTHVSEGWRASSALSEEAWSFADKSVDALMTKMKACGTRLLDLPAEMSRGSSTGDDEIFLVETNALETEKAALRTPLFASDFGRYFFEPAKDWQVIFPYKCDGNEVRLLNSTELKRTFPKTFDYLRTNEPRLRRRKQFKEWFGYSAARSLELHDRAHIAIPLLANAGIFALIPESQRGSLCVMASGGFSITLGEACNLRPQFVLGLLNSKLLFWFLERLSNVFRGGWITCTKQYFGELPIVSLNLNNKADRARHDKLVMLVDKMLALTPKLRAAKSEAERATLQNAVTGTDRQIDQLVYELYALTPEEIALVEGGQ